MTIPSGTKKTSQTLHNYNGAYTSWRKFFVHLQSSMSYNLFINFNDIISDLTECHLIT